MSGISLKNKNFIDGMRLFEEDRKVDPEFIIETLKEAIAKTYQKHIDAPEAMVRVVIEKNEMHVYHQLIVVDDETETFDETLDILYSEAIKINPDAKIGDIIEEEVDFKEIGRTSINVAKQMLKQRIKEYEKQRVYDEYKDKEYDLISGIIKTIEEKFILVDIKNTIGILLKSEQIPGEQYREGQSIRCIIKEVSKNSKGSQVVLSRADAMFVKRLFEKEVPEIAQGLVEIKAIARDAGERTKMAVYSKNDDVDAIGACIGPRGTRVQAVIGEIKGEKIDVFEWNDDIGELVKNALAPAEVKACFYANELTDPELTPEAIEEAEKYNKRPLVVVVDDDKLSVAIGKRGKNAKLAVKLTNRKIDIKTISEIEDLGIDVETEVMNFKADQARIIKEREQKKFLELQEEAAKRKAEFEEELAANDTGFDETTIEEMDEGKVEEVVSIPDENLAKAVEEKAEEPKEEVKEEVKEEPVKVEEKKAEEPVVEKPKKAPRKPLTPKTEYKSKFEDFADASKKEEASAPTKRRRKKDDEDRRVRAEDLEKKEYDEKFRPVYSEEELEEIEAAEMMEEENSWINDDDIDFDEYEDYYEED
ncbi:MAG: transcription termination/antitermination protein NusA [Erysipelotrichaceae bacterium]|nr:transcription termination/antitermination protein NusA [Erysipelotrichaceae bacterium]MBQ1691981.1 transcription termination/antitermination protein NusA [Erysipelotrichaceae bacterium]